jgi:hypothetical protein
MSKRVRISQKNIKYPKIDFNIIVIFLIISVFIFLIGKAIGKREIFYQIQENDIKKRLMQLNEI